MKYQIIHTDEDNMEDIEGLNLYYYKYFIYPECGYNVAYVEYSNRIGAFIPITFSVSNVAKSSEFEKVIANDIYTKLLKD